MVLLEMDDLYTVIQKWCLLGIIYIRAYMLFVRILTISQTKGTSSFGKRHDKTHTICRRCGRRAYHIQKSRCGSCGYPDSKMRHCRLCFNGCGVFLIQDEYLSFIDNWALKSSRRRGQGTGRMSYLKTMTRRFKNGFQEGSVAPARKN